MVSSMVNYDLGDELDQGVSFFGAEMDMHVMDGWLYLD